MRLRKALMEDSFTNAGPDTAAGPGQALRYDLEHLLVRRLEPY